MAGDSYLLLEDLGETKLEKFLSDVYINEIAEDIDRCDMCFIQSGVEYVVENMTDTLFKRLRGEIDDEIETFKRYFPKLKHIDDTNSSVSENVVKIGSFYEEATLGSPDDFHCILIIGAFQCDSDIHSCHGYPTFGQKAIIKSIRNVLHQITVQHHDTQNEAKKQFFQRHFQHSDSDHKQHIVFNKVDMEDRGRCKLTFVYSSRKNKEKILKCINVTLATAFRVHLSDNAECLGLDSFMTGSANRMTPKELLNPKEILISKGVVSIVENEHYYIRHVLSPKHKEVYTLLQHILKLNERIKPDAWTDDMKRESRAYHVTLYELKRCLVYHHYLCENNNSSGIGTCVLDIVRDMYDGDYLPQQHLSMRKRKRKRLRKLLEILKSLELSSTVYSFEDVTKLVASVEKSRNVVKTLRHVQQDHNDSLQYFKCFILVGKYIVVISVGAIILYFMFHSIVTPR